MSLVLTPPAPVSERLAVQPYLINKVNFVGRGPTLLDLVELLLHAILPWMISLDDLRISVALDVLAS